MRHNGELQDEEMINKYVYRLSLLLDETAIENYQGYYDKKNVENFLADFDVLADYYPQPARRLLISSISEFNDWREAAKNSADTNYSIYKQAVSDHTFCEIAQRTRDSAEDKYFILNHGAHDLGNDFDVYFDLKNTPVKSADTIEDISNWFIENRLPKRNFQVIPKHGENRQEVRMMNNKAISPLRCSGQEAKELLRNALGYSIGELFNYDKIHGCYIIFKFEGRNEQNMYHGYHVEMGSGEVPADIKRRLQERAKQDQ